MSRLWRVLRWGLGSLLALFVVGTLVLTTLDLEEYRPQVEQELSTALGRPVTVKGDLGFTFGLTPTVAVEDIRIANIEGASTPEFARIMRVEAAADLLALASGTLALGGIELSDVDLQLETLADGRTTWTFEPPPADPSGSAGPDLAIGDIELRRVRLNIVQPELREEIWIERLSVDLSDEEVADIDLNGSLRGRQLALEGDLPGLAAFGLAGSAAEAPALVLLQGRLHETWFEIHGEIAEPATLDGLALQLSVEEDDVTRLSPLLGQELPVEGALRLRADIVGSAARPAAENVVVVLRDEGDDYLTATGSVADLAAVTGIDLDAKLEAPRLAAVMRLPAGTPDLSGLQARVRLTGNLQRLALQMDEGQVTVADALAVQASGTLDDLLSLRGKGFRLQAKSADIRPLAAALAPDPSAASWPDLGPLALRARLQPVKGDLRLGDIDGTLGKGRALNVAFKGAVAGLLSTPALDLALDASADSLKAVTALLPADQRPTLTLPPVSGLRVTARLVGAPTALELRKVVARAELEDVTLGAEGRITGLPAAPQLDLVTRARGTSLKALEAIAGRDLPPAKDIEVTARLVGSPAALELRKIDAKAGLNSLTFGLQGRIGGLPAAPQFELVARARGDNLEGLETLTQEDLPPTGPFVASVRIAGGTDRLLLRDPDLRFGPKGGVVLQVPGEIADPTSYFQAPFPLLLTMKNTAQLTPVLGVEVPAFGRLKLNATVSGEGDTWRLSDMVLRVGDSEVAGEVSADLGAARPKVEARLRSDFINLDTFTDPDRPENRKPDPFVFDRDPFPMAALGAIDLQAEVAVKQVVSNKLLVQDFAAALTLAQGRLTMKGATARIGGGPARFNLSIDGRTARPALQGDWTLSGGNLGQMLQRLFGTDEVSGTVQARGRLSGRGLSLREIASGADGRFELVVSRGRLKTSALELIAADLLSELNFLKEKRDYANLNCLAAAFDVKKGIATPTVLLLDSDRMVMTGEGRVDLRDESLKLTLKPKPKNPSLLSLATPIDVRGTLADPNFAPSPTGLLGGAALAILGNLVVPGAGLLLPLLSTGAGKNHPCLEIAGKKAK